MSAPPPGGWDDPEQRPPGQGEQWPPPLGDPGGPPTGSSRALSSAEERNWAMAAHLSALVAFVGVPSLLGPLVVWLLRRDSSRFVDEHGKEALNFNISVLIYALVGGVVLVVVAILTLGLGLLVLIPLGLALFVAWLVVVVVAGTKASNGETYRYPVTIRFVR